MSISFKSFLQGLLNKVKYAIVNICPITFCFSSIDLIMFLISWEKVPQHRLTWPALLEHPFVKDASAQIEVSVDIFFL